MTREEATAGEVIALREQGASYREIGSRLGIARMTAWRLANGDCRRRRAEPRERRSRKVALPKVEGDGPIYPDIDPEDKDALIARLRLENDILRGMNEILKGASLGQASNREKSRLIEWLRRETSHPLRELTASLRISRSSYEYWRVHLGDVGARELLADDVERIFREDGGCVRGYRFVHAVLVAERGRPVSEKIVRDVMRERGLRVAYAKRRRAYSSYGGELDEAPANLPLREDGTHDFRADEPDRRWVTDITEFRLPDAPKVYLSPVIDLFDGKPVGWSVGLHPDAELANSSLERALEGASRAPDWVHTDRGCHYRWPGWKAICEENGIARSMSRKGRSPDNAACEGFFGRLKNEFFRGRDWSGVSAEEFMERLDDWMRFYSEGRLKAFRDEDGRWAYDTIDNRRRRLGYAA